MQLPGEQLSVPEHLSPDSAAPSPSITLSRYPCLAVAGIVCYPLTVTPLAVAQPASVQLIDAAVALHRPIVVATLRAAPISGRLPLQEELYPIGCLALVHRLVRLHDGTLRVAIEGLERVRIARCVSDTTLQVDAEILYDPIEDAGPAELQLRRVVDAQLGRLAGSTELAVQFDTAANSEHYGYMVAAGLLARFPLADRYAVLAADGLAARLGCLAALLQA
ncbi:MAG TPA: LON peptidase substrate-binding domain-containing protein [Roseiflexaceae bacterium]|nr:LON peptidase substrate-binding domain-containing protein [Roseiflexaceae bacterium]HMP39795.1 LON peptidase substrate-binding domain-containing protein [Roseiflexaceae bacterium]